MCMCAWVCVECKEINKQKTIKLFCYYTRVQVANISRYDTHTHTYLHAFMIYSHRKLLKVKRKALLRESKIERESKGDREGHPQERDSESKHTLSICLSMCVCVCLCTHSYIISTYRTKRGTTTTKQEQKRKRERGELQKHD